MKPKYFFSIFILSVVLLFSKNTLAQTFPDSTLNSSVKMYVVTKNDGTVFVGKLISQDAREVVLDTKKIGMVAIPKHEIKSIKELQPGELNKDGEYIPDEIFSTRYAFTTNGLPIEKGESYIMWTLLGPDFEFGVGKNFGLGVMTSWVGTPIIGSAKYSFELGKKVHFGLGTLLGTGSWGAPEFGIAMPYGTLTVGDRRRNLTFSGGYGASWDGNSSDGTALFSIAGMTRMGKKASFVFDSFIIPTKSTYIDDIYIFIPSIRLQTRSKGAFQFGAAGIGTGGSFIPIPWLCWFSLL